MSREGKPITILVADDDADDRMLIQDAFEESCLQNPLHFVEDGEQLLKYLRREGEYEKLRDEAFPGVILLDLNMPKMCGRTRSGPRSKTIPQLRRIPDHHSDHVEGRRRHSAHLRPRCQLVHHQAGDVRSSRRSRENDWRVLD